MNLDYHYYVFRGGILGGSIYCISSNTQLKNLAEHLNFSMGYIPYMLKEEIFKQCVGLYNFNEDFNYGSVLYFDDLDKTYKNYGELYRDLLIYELSKI